MDKYCIIGAGPSGITAAKNLRERNIPHDVYEAEDGVGGNWYFGKPRSSVYRSTHLISSKRLTQFTDFPMPASFPDFPSHAQALEYLRAYVAHFDLGRSMHFNTDVQWLERVADGWEVTVQRKGQAAEKQRYRGVIIANGHTWSPKVPRYRGTFSGQTLHSAEYKSHHVLEGKRVLVIGGGNSGCDIAVEAAQHAVKTFHSTRRAYHYIPKFIAGVPSDEIGEAMLRVGLPTGMRQLVAGLACRLMLGQPEKCGLQKPDHRIFETHPIVNSQLFYFLRHGGIVPKPDVAAFNGQEVEFSDGSREAIDVVVFATGYEMVFPFIATEHLNWKAGYPNLYLNVFHPEYDDLFVAGLIQPDSGQWGLTDYQCKVIAAYICKLNAGGKDPASRWFKSQKRQGQGNYSGGIHYRDSSRHRVEVEHFSYRRTLQSVLARLEGTRERAQASAV